jgi:polyisoprenoid-binding protein YceI
MHSAIPQDAYEIGVETSAYPHPLMMRDVTRLVATSVDAGRASGFDPTNTIGSIRACPTADLEAVVDGRWARPTISSAHAGPCMKYVGSSMRLVALFLLVSAVYSSTCRAQVPVFEVNHADSSVKFNVSASVAIAGTFDKWDASLTLTSPELSSGVLDIKIQAESVDTGSGMKNGKLKGKDFFAVKENPLITFHSTKVVQTGPDTVEFDGDFAIRGVTKPEKLTFTITGRGTGEGAITGTMAFDRKEFGMNSGIPFIKIADRVEVTVDLKGKRVSGPPVVFKE